MNRHIRGIVLAGIIGLVAGLPPAAHTSTRQSSLTAAAPFDGKTFKGRIAWSADGNFNDEDDWAASPVALAIFAGFGAQDRLVHFDYNNILPKTDPAWEKEHETGVLGAAERYGFRRAVFHNCRRDLDGAVESIRNAVNASSAENPLYYVFAGPMEVPYLGIEKSGPAKRRFVTCISHSRWNDGYTSGNLVKHDKRHVIPLGVTWVQITDQNPLLSTSPYGRPARQEEWRPWEWMSDATDTRVRFLWDRMRASKRADCSDAGMAYFLMTGDEQADPEKLRKLFVDRRIPAPINIRKRVRLEAENFRALDGFTVENVNERAASHRLTVKLAEKPGGASLAGQLRTRFDEPYTADAGIYDVAVRYFDEGSGRSQLRLLVNGAPQGEPWQASADDKSWKTHTIPGVKMRRGDEIAVEVRRDGSESGKLDYVELHYQGPR